MFFVTQGTFLISQPLTPGMMAEEERERCANSHFLFLLSSAEGGEYWQEVCVPKK